MHPRHLLTFVAVVALGGLLVACDSDSGNGSGAQDDEGGVTVTQREEEERHAEEGGTVEVEVGERNGEMFMTVSPESVPAGPTTFTVKNVGNIEHEMLVMQPGIPWDQMPINEDDEVDESSLVGEHHADHIAAGRMGTMTMDLEPGEYALVCNIAGHYRQGMRAPFTVT